MAISTVGSVSAAVTSATNGNLTFTEPTGTAQNDYHIVSITIRGGRGYQTPTGWTKLHEDLTGNTTAAGTGSKTGYQVFYIKRGASAPTMVFTANATGTADLSYGRIRTYRGVHPTTPFRSSFANTQASAVTPFTSTGTAAVTAGDMIVQCLFGARNVTWSAQTRTGGPTLTELIDTGTTNGADGSHAWAELLVTSTAAAATFAATPSATALHAMFVGILQPEVFAKTSTIVENFNDNSINATIWDSFVNNGGTVAETNQRLETTLLNGVDDCYGVIFTKTYYELKDSSIFCRINWPATVDNVDFYIQLGSVDGADRLLWVRTGSLVHARSWVASVGTNHFTDTYVPADHAWFRIREASGTTYWETAPLTASNPPVEGDWVLRHSRATPLDATKLLVEAGGMSFNPPASDPGMGWIDGINAASTDLSSGSPYTLTVTARSYAVTTSVVGLYRVLRLNVSTGLYSALGGTQTLLWHRRLSVTPQSYGAAGGSVALLWNRRLAVSPAAYTLNTSTITLLRRLLLSVTAASCALTANTVGLRKTWVLAVTPAAVTAGTNPASLYAQRRLSVTPAAVAVTANAVNLTYVPANTYVLNVTTAAFAVTASPVNLTVPDPGTPGADGYPLYRMKGRR